MIAFHNFIRTVLKKIVIDIIALVLRLKIKMEQCFFEAGKINRYEYNFV